MAILQRTVNGSFTEIYIGGGNGWITQSAPTNFHQFWKQKILGPDESIDDFREVSGAEKQQLLDSDAKWIEPSEEFIAEWDDAWKIGDICYGQFNRDSGFFEGNGEKAITTEQARQILRIGRIDLSQVSEKPFVFTKGYLPTLLPLTGNFQCSLFLGAVAVSAKVLRILDYHIIGANLNPETTPIRVTATREFGYLSSIEEVKGILDVSKETSATSNQHFYNGFTYAGLKTLWLYHMVQGINLSIHPDFRLECVAYMVNNAANSKPITITLHPTAYARVTDEIFAAAAEKQITIAST